MSLILGFFHRRQRLADAIRDNDRVEAIIAASGTNQSGLAESLTMPHAPTQAMLFSANCDRANISPLAIRAVEAHGTGTQAGDYAEMEAIKTAFCRDRPPVSSKSGPSSTLFVSSVKPNIGHAESASGIASLLKAVLMLKHKTMLPHIGISTNRNPRLGNLDSHGIVIPTSAQPLQPVAGYEDIFISVNNFGAPGEQLRTASICIGAILTRSRSFRWKREHYHPGRQASGCYQRT
jgi:acyl transferase domain-containing protein